MSKNLVTVGVLAVGAVVAGLAVTGKLPFAPKPVSYTHLDVYKRQGL